MNMIDIHRKRSRDVLNPKNLLAEMYAWIPLRPQFAARLGTSSELLQFVAIYIFGQQF
jgi:hypothetical protein